MYANLNKFIYNLYLFMNNNLKNLHKNIPKRILNY